MDWQTDIGDLTRAQKGDIVKLHITFDQWWVVRVELGGIGAEAWHHLPKTG